MRVGEHHRAGPIPDGLLRSLDLGLRRRIDGLLAGEQPSTSLGPGTEIAQVRPYVPGDDPRRVAWAQTARTGEMMVRDDVAERSVVTWMVLDTSASMGFGTADRRKSDVAAGAVLALGHVASRRGGRVGLLAFGAGRERVAPPRQGRAALASILSALSRERSEAESGATELGPSLERVGHLARRRGLVVCLADLRGPRDWERPLLLLAARHDVLVIEVRDPREQSIPDVGVVSLTDPETGRQLRVDTSDRRLRERFAEAAAGERSDVAAAIRRTGADHCVLSTGGDWLGELARHLLRRGLAR